MRAVSSDDFNKAGWVTFRVCLFVFKEEATIIEKTTASIREINKSRHSLRNKAAKYSDTGTWVNRSRDTKERSLSIRCLQACDT